MKVSFELRYAAEGSSVCVATSLSAYVKEEIVDQYGPS